MSPELQASLSVELPDRETDVRIGPGACGFPCRESSKSCVLFGYQGVGDYISCELDGWHDMVDAGHLRP